MMPGVFFHNNILTYIHVVLLTSANQNIHGIHFSFVAAILSFALRMCLYICNFISQASSANCELLLKHVVIAILFFILLAILPFVCYVLLTEFII